MIEHEDETLYQVTVRDTLSKDNIFSMFISLALAKEIFATKDSTPEEIEEVLIVYKLNKPAFLNMIASLNIQDDKFTIDFSKINDYKENGLKNSSRLHIEQSFEDQDDNMGDFREDFSVIQTSSKYDDQS
jgi:hypothetical protein